MRQLGACAHVLAVLCTLAPVGYRVRPDDVRAAGDAQVDSSAEVERLRGLVRARLAEAEIRTPVQPEQLASLEARSIVEDALQRAVTAYVGWHAHVSLEETNVRVRVTEPAPANVSGWGMEAQQSVLNKIERARQVVNGLAAIIDKVSADMFTRPPRAQVALDQTAALATWDPLQSVGDATPRPGLLASAAAPSVDYRLLWRTVLQNVRAYNGAGAEQVLMIERELPQDRFTGRFTLHTRPIGSRDADWIYQTYYEVTLWDPGVRDAAQAGREARIGVELVIGYRKEATAFRYVRRSNDRTEGLLTHLLAAIGK